MASSWSIGILCYRGKVRKLNNSRYFLRLFEEVASEAVISHAKKRRFRVLALLRIGSDDNDSHG
jgi:hypothetical protein